MRCQCRIADLHWQLCQRSIGQTARVMLALKAMIRRLWLRNLNCFQFYLQEHRIELPAPLSERLGMLCRSMAYWRRQSEAWSRALTESGAVRRILLWTCDWVASLLLFLILFSGATLAGETWGVSRPRSNGKASQWDWSDFRPSALLYISDYSIVTHTQLAANRQSTRTAEDSHY